MGNIGFTIAKRAFACGMKILYSGRTKKLLHFILFLNKMLFNRNKKKTQMLLLSVLIYKTAYPQKRYCRMTKFKNI